MISQPCTKCSGYLTGWKSHSPNFPDYDWTIIEKRDIQVGTHAAVDVMEGTASCKICGYIANFSCSYGDGYSFTEAKTVV